MSTPSKKQGLQPAVVTSLTGLADYVPDAIISRELVKNGAGTITFFAFGAGQGLSRHSAPFDAFVHVLDGEALITIGETDHRVRAGEVVLMPANVPHAVQAPDDFKMLLVMHRG